MVSEAYLADLNKEKLFLTSDCESLVHASSKLITLLQNREIKLKNSKKRFCFSFRVACVIDCFRIFFLESLVSTCSIISLQKREEVSKTHCF